MYNLQYRLFTEDSLTKGYGFGDNNPVMRSNPSGNIPEWVGTTFINGWDILVRLI